MTDLIRMQKQAFKVGDITDESCLKLWEVLTQKKNIIHDAIYEYAMRTMDYDPSGVLNLKKYACVIFYEIGMIELKLSSQESYSDSFKLGTISPSLIQEDTGIRVHKMFWRALNIPDN